jgi:hypothetical protein
MKHYYQIAFIFLLSLPTVAFAQLSYRAMVGIPGYDAVAGGGGENTFSAFIGLIYGLAITLAALLAVIKIVIAGVKWMLSDVVTDKTNAKDDIRGALLGLIVIISAVLIITIINPDIVGAAS